MGVQQGRVGQRKACAKALLRAASATVLGFAIQSVFAGAASAEEPAAKPDPAAAAVSEVVVTASRIQRSGFTAPTPVTTLGEEQLHRQAASNVGDVLNTIPSFRATSTTASSGVSSRGGGTVFAELRGIGSVRTLVLVDGHRFVPSTTTGQVDLNQVPDLLIERVDVVTGGASAAWGSDAVAGVVNLILKKDLQGVQGVASYGITGHSDGEEYRVSLAGGTHFADDRGQVMAAIDYVTTKAVGDQYSRDFGQGEAGLITNTAFATNGLANFLIANNVRPSNMAPGGLITSGPLKGIQFGPGGTPMPFQYGQVFGNFMIGGSNAGYNLARGLPLGTPLDRANFYSHASYRLTDTINVVGEASYAWTHVMAASQQPRDGGNIVVRSDNAYLPTSIATQMAGLGLTTFNLGRLDEDIGHAVVDNTTKTGRVLLAVDGKFGDGWKWDAYLQYGKNETQSNILNNRITQNWLQAIDAVRSPSGAIVCRTSLANPLNGCVPFNIFGSGSASAAALAYVVGTTQLLQTTQQTVAAVNLQGAPFSTWAGPVSIAVGAEARKEQGAATSDPISQQLQANGARGGFNLGNPQPMKGEYTVKEVYAETVVPLAKDLTFAKSLELNGAVRRTDYSTSGPVTTWKVGLSYTPFDDLRFRVTRSQDIRAPNLDELYSGARTIFVNLFDPAVGQTLQVRTLVTGNINLKPEEAQTWTGGVVYQPSWIPRLRMSVDYFNIDLSGAISTLGGPQIVARCTAGQTDFCARIIRTSTGQIDYVLDTNLNLNGYKTSGLDLEAAYSVPLSDLVASADGDLRLSALGSYVGELTTTDSTGLSINRAGKVSARGGTLQVGVPKWRWTLSGTYDRGPVSVTLQSRIVGKGVFDEGLVEGAGQANTTNKLNYPAVVYFDLSGRYVLRGEQDGRRLEVFGVINNLLDRNPPIIPSGASGFTYETSTNTTFYDAVGRAFKIGVRFAY